MENKIEEDYHVISYQQIDDLRCFHPLVDVFKDPELPASSEDFIQVELLQKEIAKLFRDKGWEGDGTIRVFFVPPCFSRHGDKRDPTCIEIYHVKQQNNGTSWLAIPKDFEFRMPK